MEGDEDVVVVLGSVMRVLLRKEGVEGSRERVSLRCGDGEGEKM